MVIEKDKQKVFIKSGYKIYFQKTNKVSNMQKRKNNDGQNKKIKLQNTLSKVNVMKVPNLGNGSPQKRMIKIDLKLQYLLNQLNSLRKFKDFLDDLNLFTKETMINRDQSENNHMQKDKADKKKNSFSLTHSLNEIKIKQQKMKSKQENNTITEHKKSHQSIIQTKFQKIHGQKLKQVREMIITKKNQLLSHIQLIKKRINSSSIWDDKYFYDFTESNYEEKTLQVQENMRKTEQNLQKRQKQKKELNSNPNALISRTKNIKYTCYSQDEEEGKIANENVQVKRNVMFQIKRINQLQNTLSAILQQNQNISEQKLVKQQQKLSNHPYVKALIVLANQLKNIEIKINVKKNLNQQDKEQNDNQQNRQKQPKILQKIIRLFNKQIIHQELLKTKNKISQLKHQTSNLQNGIKELQGYKALMILRNKINENSTEINNKKLHISQKINYDDQILRQILEHQFLNKSITLKIQTKFCGLKKKEVHSFSDTHLKVKMNYFPNINKPQKCISQKNIKNINFIEKRTTNEVLPLSPAKKNIKLQVTTSKSSKKKQTGSSAETNP